MLRDIGFDMLPEAQVLHAGPTAEFIHVAVAPTPVAPVVAPVNESKTHLLRDVEQWDWRQLRDYVITQIEARQGQIPRDSRKEAAVFKRFVKQWGPISGEIARYAFEVCGGKWAGAPIGVNRFCKSSDVYFGLPIAERLLAVRG